MKHKDLLERYPELYSDLPYGIECGEGWGPLLDDLSQVLTAIGGVRAAQVKEKFGTLRFYIDGHGPGVDSAIRMAEIISAHTCEGCGKQGKLRQGSWWRTLCDKCHQ